MISLKWTQLPASPPPLKGAPKLQVIEGNIPNKISTIKISPLPGSAMLLTLPVANLSGHDGFSRIVSRIENLVVAGKETDRTYVQGLKDVANVGKYVPNIDKINVSFTGNITINSGTKGSDTLSVHLIKAMLAAPGLDVSDIADTLTVGKGDLDNDLLNQISVKFAKIDSFRFDKNAAPAAKQIKLTDDLSVSGAVLNGLINVDKGYFSAPGDTANVTNLAVLGDTVKSYETLIKRFKGLRNLDLFKATAGLNFKNEAYANVTVTLNADSIMNTRINSLSGNDYKLQNDTRYRLVLGSSKVLRADSLSILTSGTKSTAGSGVNFATIAADTAIAKGDSLYFAFRKGTRVDFSMYNKDTLKFNYPVVNALAELYKEDPSALSGLEKVSLLQINVDGTYPHARASIDVSPFIYSEIIFNPATVGAYDVDIIGIQTDRKYSIEDLGKVKSEIIRDRIESLELEVGIPGSTVVPSGVAERYPNVKSVTIGAGITKIEDGTFQGARDLTDLDLSGSDDLKTIGIKAFKNTGLRKITIGGSLKEIAADAFDKEDIETINVKSGIPGLNFGTLFENTTDVIIYFDGVKGMDASALFDDKQDLRGDIAKFDISTATAANVDKRVAKLVTGTLKLDASAASGLITAETGSKFTHISALEVGNNITNIESGSFRNAVDGVVTDKDGRITGYSPKLKTIKFGSSVKDIGTLAFAPTREGYNFHANETTGIKDEELYKKVSAVSSITFAGQGAKLREIGDGAFAYAIPTADVDIHNAENTTLNIGHGAFFNSGLVVEVATRAAGNKKLILPAKSNRTIADAAFLKPSLTGESAGVSDITSLEITSPEADFSAWHRQIAFSSEATTAVLPLILDVTPAERDDWNEGQVIRWDYFNNANIGKEDFYVGTATAGNADRLLINKSSQYYDKDGKVDTSIDYRNAEVHYNGLGQFRLRAEYGAPDASDQISANDEITSNAQKATGKQLDITDDKGAVTGKFVEVEVGKSIELTAVFDDSHAWQLVKWSYNPSNVILIESESDHSAPTLGNSSGYSDRTVFVSNLANTVGKTTVLTATTSDGLVATVEVRVVKSTGIDAVTAGSVSVSYANGVLTLTNLDGTTATVVSLNGKTAAKFAVSGNEAQKAVALAPGFYILNAGNTVSKFIVR
ncbi:hypothetical protein Barb4_01656 [Bacteroidales bacterium Barb4]|nr:hypothetical protein Barb4_01656 [Bacteroidales bacterium Barb4]